MSEPGREEPGWRPEWRHRSPHSTRPRRGKAPEVPALQRKALAQTKRVVELAKAIDPSQLRATPRTEADLWSLVRTLVGRVEELSAEVKELRSRVEPTPLEIDPIDEKVAEERVLAYYDERPGELIYPSDVAEALGLDAYMVFEITNKLTAAGKLK